MRTSGSLDQDPETCSWSDLPDRLVAWRRPEFLCHCAGVIQFFQRAADHSTYCPITFSMAREQTRQNDVGLRVNMMQSTSERYSPFAW